MTDEKKIWPPPPRQQQIPVEDIDAHAAAVRLAGIGSICAAVVGNLVSLGTENFYIVMGPRPFIVMRLVSACILSVALLLGVFGIRLWPGKMGWFLSACSLIGVLKEVLEFIVRK